MGFQHEKRASSDLLETLFADEARFELAEGVNPHTLSRRAP